MSGREEKGNPNAKSRHHDLFTAILGGSAAFLLVTLRIHIDTTAVPYPFYKGPVIFPLIVLSVMVLASLPSIFRLMKPEPNATWHLDSKGWPLRPAITIIFLILFFIFGISTIGVEASVFLFLLISNYVLGFRGAKVNLLLPIVYTAIIVLIFKYILDIWFPKPLLMSLVGG
ncbi:MAG: tripartite tricarboxylate transporter TctB family protein [Deltaproteobacteria bacterium]|nr:tripartite tricarboxylate transporter TctB family protein [Deltaproteobacteria bacterium]